MNLKCLFFGHKYSAVLHLNEEDWDKNYVECSRCGKRFEKGTGGISWGIVGEDK
jgi:hypothetical protein